jgi:hypothetical protein
MNFRAALTLPTGALNGHDGHMRGRSILSLVHFCSLAMACSRRVSNGATARFPLRNGLSVTLVQQRMLHLVHFFLDFIFH